ncbi:MAG: hypothetical protein QM607_05175 [Microbacterium sp.]
MGEDQSANLLTEPLRGIQIKVAPVAGVGECDLPHGGVHDGDARLFVACAQDVVDRACEGRGADSIDDDHIFGRHVILMTQNASIRRGCRRADRHRVDAFVMDANQGELVLGRRRDMGEHDRMGTRVLMRSAAERALTRFDVRGLPGLSVRVAPGADANNAAFGNRDIERAAVCCGEQLLSGVHVGRAHAFEHDSCAQRVVEYPQENFGTRRELIPVDGRSVCPTAE